ncbi:MAG: class I SAM-dependent methyltransferase [Alphaproteobacteria bacterium]
MSSRTLNLDDRLIDYLRSVSVKDTPILAKLRAETAKQKMAVMQISPEQGQFMALLVELMGARRTIEVGTFTGYSALVVAMALPAQGRVVACDVSEEWTSIGRRHWAEAGVAHKIDLRLGPAAKTLDAMIESGESALYDFAFIDANKEDYDAYYERCLVLLRQGGIVAIDNVLWSGKVADDKAHDKDTDAIRALNAKIAEDSRVTSCMLPIGDGLTLCRKR